MGHKVNPVLFRLGVSAPKLSSWWYTYEDSYSHLLFQDLELRKFLFEMLRSKGILIRFCHIERLSQKVVISLDLYFSYLLSKQAKFNWARGLFKNVKKKYFQVNRIADIRGFVLDGGSNLVEVKKKYLKAYNRSNKFFFKKGVKGSLFSKVCYKKRLFFFLVQREKFFVRKEEAKVLSIQGSLKSSKDLVRLGLKKFNRIFVLEKIRYNFNCFKLVCNPAEFCFTGQYLFELNKSLSRSILQFLGNEEVQLNFFSSQLNYLPLFKLYQKSILKDLYRFQRNRDLGKFFTEGVEVLFLVTRTFGFGNAFLLGQQIVFFLENTRKQVFIAKFLKKTLQVLFKLLPEEELAISGIKILIRGRFDKRRRTKKLLLQEGEMSLQTIASSVDYSQAQAVTIYGSFGVKVWISKRMD